MVDFKERKICLFGVGKKKKILVFFFLLQSVVEMEAENRLHLTATET